MREIKTGWGNPSWDSSYRSEARPEYHYFGPNGLSLCGRHGVGHTRELEEGRDDHSDNCPICMRKKLEMSAKEEEQGG